MFANELGHRFDARMTHQVDRDSARARQTVPIELQPSRVAAARQPAIGNDDISVAARVNEVRPLEPIR
jgi:hypothetical protein